VLVANVALGRQPLYGFDEWASSFEPQLLGLDGRAPETLSDDCVERALDVLFLADRASLLTALSLSAISAYRMLDGNTEDSTTHVATWERYRALAGRSDFLYLLTDPSGIVV